jgi:hypothetical protein
MNLTIKQLSTVIKGFTVLLIALSSGCSMAALPKPNNQMVQLREVPAQRLF